MSKPKSRAKYMRQYRQEHPESVSIWKYRAALRLIAKLEAIHPEYAKIRAAMTMAGGQEA